MAEPMDLRMQAACEHLVEWIADVLDAIDAADERPDVQAAEARVMADHCTANGQLGHCGCWNDPDDGQCCWCTESNPSRILCGLCRGTGDWQEEFIDSAGGVGIRGGVCSVCDGTGLKP